MKTHYAYPMTQDMGPKFFFTYIRDNGEEVTFQLGLYRGKNANVSLRFNKNFEFFREAADLTSPFSVFVPGLAGLPLVAERRANAIVQSGIAQGDANLFLRNVLHRLSRDQQKLTALHQLMDDIFPGFQTRTIFDENVNQYISTEVRLGQFWTPLEMAGTGCLQALQVAAYVILYAPRLLLLDEPDAHLHPGNQKKLVDLFFSLSQTAGTQIILASHSRHVFDAVSTNALGAIHWLEEGQLVEDERADVALLMDIGALDNFANLASEQVRTLVFAEDEKKAKLRTLLEANGWNLNNVEFVSFNGVDNLEATKVVVEYFLGLGDNRQAIIYRDGDCMTANEKHWLRQRYEQTLPENAIMYISPLTDVEHFFCTPGHVAAVAQIDEEEAQDVVDEVVQEKQGLLGAKLGKKRVDLAFKALKTFADRSDTEDLVANGVSFEMSLGKLLMPRIIQKLQERGTPAPDLVQPSAALIREDLQGLAPE